MSPATKLWLLLTTVFISFSIQAQDLSRALWGAPVSELRTKSEAGDPEAQCKLAAAYEVHYDRKTNAIYWYRKAARQGNAEGQYGLARLLPKPDDEKWCLLAANQNHFNAQQFMARICEDRHKDKIEACKWAVLFVNQRPAYRPFLDQLTLKMTSSEFAEAQKRAAAFVPTKPCRIEPELKLQSIIGTGNNRLALINGHTFKAGEQAQLKIDDETVSAKCLEVAARSAVIEIDGTQRNLSLQ